MENKKLKFSFFNKTIRSKFTRRKFPAKTILKYKLQLKLLACPKIKEKDNEKMFIQKISIK